MATINYEKWGAICKWLAIVPTVFFFVIIVWGLYLGVTGQQEFTFLNSAPDEVQASP